MNEKQINDYYKENKINYLVPENIFVDLIEINIENFKNLENIGSDIAKEYYNNNIGQYTKKKTEIFIF